MNSQVCHGVYLIINFWLIILYYKHINGTHTLHTPHRKRHSPHRKETHATYHIALTTHSRHCKHYIEHGIGTTEHSTNQIAQHTSHRTQHILMVLSIHRTQHTKQIKHTNHTACSTNYRTQHTLYQLDLRRSSWSVTWFMASII